MNRLGPGDVRDVLRGASLLRSIREDDLETLAGLAIHRSIQPGQVIFSKGEASRSVYWLATGQVRITSFSRHGGELLLGMAEAGETFGELALIEGFRRIVNAIAEQPSYLVSLTRLDLIPVLERNQGAAMAFSRLLARHLRTTMNDLTNLGLHEASERLYLKLLALGRRYSRLDVESGVLHIDHGLSQEDIARSIGLTRVMVNRQLSEWRAAGLIDYGRGTIFIHDPDALEAHVQRNLFQSQRDSG